jgi:oligo-1,6-glucosidase
VYGKYTLLDKNNPNVYAYTREGEGEKNADRFKFFYR